MSAAGSSRLVRTNTLPSMARGEHTSLSSNEAHSVSYYHPDLSPSVRSYSPFHRMHSVGIPHRLSSPALYSLSRRFANSDDRTGSVAVNHESATEATTSALFQNFIDVEKDTHNVLPNEDIPSRGFVSIEGLKFANDEDSLSDAGDTPASQRSQYPTNAHSHKKSVSRLRTVTDKMGCVLNILKQHVLLQCEQHKLDFKEGYHRYVLLPTIEAWFAEARECQLLDEAGVGDVRLSVDVTVMLRRMNLLVKRILKDTPRCQFRHFAPFLQSEPARHRMLHQHQLLDLQHMNIQSSFGSLSSISSSASSYNENFDDGFDIFNGLEVEWFRRVLNRLVAEDNDEDLLDMLDNLFQESETELTPAVESNQVNSSEVPASITLPDNELAHISETITSKEEISVSPLNSIFSEQNTSIQNVSFISLAEYLRNEIKDDHHSLKDGSSPNALRSKPVLNPDSSPSVSEKIQPVRNHSSVSSETATTSHIPIITCHSLQESSQEKATSSSTQACTEVQMKVTAPDQSLITIVEKLLMICPVDMLIMILRHPYSYLPTVVASKVQHLVECSVSEVHLQELYVSVSEGEMKRHMGQYWVRQPHLGVAVTNDRSHVRMLHLSSIECSICLDERIPCWYRACCSKLICEGCLQSYVAQMVNDGVTEMPCPCAQSCRGNLYKAEITLRLTKELHAKYHHFLDNANQNSRRKTCPRCSHLTEMSLVEEKMLRKSAKRGMPVVKKENSIVSKRPSLISRLFRTSFRSDTNNNVSTTESKATFQPTNSPNGLDKASEATSSSGTESNVHVSEPPSTDLTNVSVAIPSVGDEGTKATTKKTKTRFKNSRHAERAQGGLCVTCPRCQLRWCFACHAPAHIDLTCKEWRHGDKLVKQWADTPVTSNDPLPRFILREEFGLEGDVVQMGNTSRKARKCPTCGIFIERVQGCPHMVCSQCKTLWCYDCGQRRIDFKYLGGHDSRFSIFGCSKRYLPNRPHLRRFIRGNMLVLFLLSVPVMVVLVVGAGIVILPIAASGFACYKIYSAIRKRLQ